MPHQVNWYLENRVIFLSSYGEITDQDLLGVDQPIIDYMNHSDATLVHLIVDAANMTTPPSFKVVSQLKWPKHPQYGWAIIIGLKNPIQRFFVAVATNVFKTRQRMFNTLDEALDFLNEIDSTLPVLRDSQNKKAS